MYTHIYSGLSGHGFGGTLGVGDGKGGLACCGSWDHKESDTTEQLNWTELRDAACESCFVRIPGYLPAPSALPSVPHLITNPHVSFPPGLTQPFGSVS